MEVLKSFLRNLDGEEARAAFAEACGTSLGHLRNCIYGGKLLAVPVCVQIERRSGLAVRRWDLRPDWRDNWPELLEVEGAPVAAQLQAVSHAG